MTKRSVRFIALLFVPVGLVGCVEPEGTNSMNVPSLSNAKSDSHLAEFFAYHNDQGLLADRSIADIHFVPHMAQLSGTGQARLDRYAELLASTGGTLHYDTKLQDREMIQARLKLAMAYLTEAYPGSQDINIVVGMAGGRGLSATEAIADQGVARLPEPRNSAYHLSDASGLRSEE